MSALESSPVHCLNPRPTGNRRRPGNDGTAAMLHIICRLAYIQSLNDTSVLPTVNICHNSCSPCFSMLDDEVVTNPGNKMVFESAFDDLVEKIGSKEFVDICTWK